jgi:hypothetical protein
VNLAAARQIDKLDFRFFFIETGGKTRKTMEDEDCPEGIG